MAFRQFGLTAMLIIGLAGAAGAQSPSARPDAPSAASSGSNPQSLDVSRLPIDLERIQRQLRQSTVREDLNGLSLRYIIDVYGQAPRIELFTPQDNLRNGPVPYGAPTHQEMIRQMTPQEYRAPAMDFGALLRWLSDRGDKK